MVSKVTELGVEADRCVRTLGVIHADIGLQCPYYSLRAETTCSRARSEIPLLGEAF